MMKEFLHPGLAYIPKVPTNVARSIVRDPDQERNNLLSPIRALDAYVHRASLWCKSEQLFICCCFFVTQQGVTSRKA